jgi:acetyl esterase
MPLDQELASLLSRADGLRLPSLRDYSPAQARTLHSAAAAAALRSAGVAPVESVQTVHVPTPAGPLELRVYRPSDCPVPAPAVVYLHGGGWVLGDLDVQDATCRHLAQRCRAVVVSVRYRLAPEHPYPAAVHDSCDAVVWTHAHADQLQIDDARVALAGSSAGGNVAAGTTLRLRDQGQPLLAAQLLLYPPTDPSLSSASVRENGSGYYLTADDMRDFVDAYLPDPTTRSDAYAAPLYAPSLAGLPPAVVATAGFDPLRDEGVAYAERLRASDVHVQHLHYPSLIHGFFAFARQSKTAARAREEVLDAFASLLAPAGGGLDDHHRRTPRLPTSTGKEKTS